MSQNLKKTSNCVSTMFRLSAFALLATLASAKLSSPEASVTQTDKQQDQRKLVDYIEQQHVGQFKITVTNMAFQQPMSRFFASVHSDSALPIYELGKPASQALALLAETGDPQPLVNFYSNPAAGSFGVGDAGIVTDGPLVPAEPRSFVITTSYTHPYVSFASMAVNTNDCFVGAAGILLRDGLQFTVPGLDAGSEENNELCNSIPGPACANIDTFNVRSGNGEGFVHVHRGFFGAGPDLSQSGYDWRNPMLQINIERLQY